MNKIRNLIPLVKPYYTSPDPAHDWAHIGRVAQTARKLAESESVNVEYVLASVYCHDLVNIPKDHPHRKEASTLSANAAEPLLKEAGFDSSEIEIIKKGIIEHSFSRGLRPSCLEAAIVQDADRLDALGSIGILRCAAVNAQMKSQFYDPFDPFAEKRDLDDRTFMLDHYFVKLFKLPDLMNTKMGKTIGLERVKFMENFITQLTNEIR